MLQSSTESFACCEEFIDELQYVDLLRDVVANTYRSGRFIEMFYLASEPGLQKTIWQIAALPTHRMHMVQELVAMLGKDAAEPA